MSTATPPTHDANLTGLRVLSTPHENTPTGAVRVADPGVIISQHRPGWVLVMLEDGQVREVQLWRCTFMDPDKARAQIGGGAK